MLRLIASIKVWHLTLSLIAIVGIIAFAAYGVREKETPARLWDTMTTPKHWAGEQTQSTGEKIRLTHVCSEVPAKVVRCAFIPFDAEHRTEAEQKLYEELN